MSRVTEAMVRRALEVMRGRWGTAEAARAALEAVEAELCEPGPFVLSAQEQSIVAEVWQDFEHTSDTHPDRAIVLLKALDRALRTLGPQPAQGGEWALEDAERLNRARAKRAPIITCADADDAVLAALNECFPRGKPVAQELTQHECDALTHAAYKLDGIGENECARVVRKLRNDLTLTPRKPTDPVRELLAEMRSNEHTHPRETANLAVWADRFEAALAARDAQKAGK